MATLISRKGERQILTFLAQKWYKSLIQTKLVGYNYLGSMLSLSHLSVTAQGKRILHDITYTFTKGKVYAVMGPNGSGKSTLAQSIAGNPSYKIATKSAILLNKKKIQRLSPADRAKQGLFVSFQHPLAIPGVTIYQLLRVALEGKKDPLTIRREVDTYAHQLEISHELLERPLNEDFSGGEKKKMEVLQAVMLGGSVLIFDEIDTGTDVDTLRTIGKFIARLKKDRVVILITHYTRLLKYCAPEVVIVLKNGTFAKIGNKSLASVIEKSGYEKITPSKK